MLRVSIALGTYNGERFLREQLDSLARQTLLPCEVVVADDHSNDQTWSILEGFAREAPFPVRLHRNERNLGWQENFVRAALRCEGQWVAFCDQDDVWKPEKLQRIAECVERHPDVVMVVHSASMASEELVPLGAKLPDIKRFRLVEPLHNAPLFTQLGFACCFDRDLLRDVPVDLRPCDPNIPNRKQSHDQLVTLLANVLGQVAYLPDELAIYRRHGSAATGEAGTGTHQRNLRRLFRGVLGAGSDHYEFHAKIARDNAAFLEQVKERQPPERAQRYATAVDFYRLLASWLSRRAVLYRPEQSSLSRAKLLVKAARAGAYAEIGPGIGLGWRALCKDVAFTALGPLIRLNRHRVGPRAH